MSIYFEKARELGNLILSSEQSLRLSDAHEAYKNNEEAKVKLEEYKAYQKNIGEGMQSGVLPKEEFQRATKVLTEMGAELKKHPVVGELISAENEFNGFVNQVMNILKQTIMGTDSECAGNDSCSGGCSKCK